jgi:hypothetical protein
MKDKNYTPSLIPSYDLVDDKPGKTLVELDCLDAFNLFRSGRTDLAETNPETSAMYTACLDGFGLGTIEFE